MIHEKKLNLYSLEVHLTSHCNIACKGCAQSSPLTQEKYQSTDQLRASLNILGQVLTFSKIQVLGGEPLIHPELIPALREIKSSFNCTKLCAKTNGLLLHTVHTDFWRLVDQVIVSVYPSTLKLLKRQQESLTELANKFECQVDYRYFPHFNHIRKPIRTESERITQHIFSKCEYKDFTISLSGQRLYRCAPSVNHQTASIPGEEKDSILLDESDNLPEKIRMFLTSESHLAACRYCLGSCGALFDHKLLKVRDLNSTKFINDYYR